MIIYRKPVHFRDEIYQTQGFQVCQNKLYNTRFLDNCFLYRDKGPRDMCSSPITRTSGFNEGSLGTFNLTMK